MQILIELQKRKAKLIFMNMSQGKSQWGHSNTPPLTPPQLLHVHRVDHELPVLLLLLAKVEGVALVLRLRALAPVVLGAVVVHVGVVEAVQGVRTLRQHRLQQGRTLCG